MSLENVAGIPIPPSSSFKLIIYQGDAVWVANDYWEWRWIEYFTISAKREKETAAAGGGRPATKGVGDFITFFHFYYDLNKKSGAEHKECEFKLPLESQIRKLKMGSLFSRRT